jgi:putative aldouronate transport system permease protein
MLHSNVSPARTTTGEWVFFIVNTTALLVITAIAMYPILNVLATSLSSGSAAERGIVSILPQGFSTNAWQFVLSDPGIWRSLGNTTFVAGVGTVLSLVVTALFAYPLAKSYFGLRRILMVMVVFTMIFRWPIIPYFLSIRSYGLLDSLWSQILPHLVIATNLVIMRTFFMQLPEELEEAAHIEGANALQILFRIVVPLSKPVFATLGLFYAVTLWNLFLHGTLFLRSEEMFTLQLRIRALISMTADSTPETERFMTRAEFSQVTIEAATVMFGTIPIVLVYPFLQKYFVKGAMLGSLKG